jgi:hypothetical protein
VNYSEGLPALPVGRRADRDLMQLLLSVLLCAAPTLAHGLALPVAQPSPGGCDLCVKIADEAAAVSGNKTAMAEAIAALDGQCGVHFKGNLSLVLLCDLVAKLAVEKLLPSIVKGLDNLAWDAHATCAALQQCEVPCCLTESEPEQVHLSLTRWADEMAVSWTTQNATQTSIVQWGTDPQSLDANNATGSAAGDLGEALLGWRGVVHRAILRPLVQGVRYYYRVGDAVGGFSAVRSFRTLAAGAGSDVPLRIAWVADMGWGGASDGTIAQLTRLATSENASERIDLVVHNGDIGYADGNMGRWDTFMRKIEPVASIVPYMTTPGNHEFYFDFSAYKHRFRMPDLDFSSSSRDEDGLFHNNMYYSLELGLNASSPTSSTSPPATSSSGSSSPSSSGSSGDSPGRPMNMTSGVHLVGMNTESPIDLAHISHSQQKWLAADLATPRGVSAASWTIAFGHRPLYCSNTGGNDVPHGNEVLKKKIEDTLVRSVDLVVQGHVHDYERSWPVSHGNVTATSYTSPTAPV